MNYHFLSLVALCRDEVKWAAHHDFTFLPAFVHPQEAEQRPPVPVWEAEIGGWGEGVGPLPSEPASPIG